MKQAPGSQKMRLESHVYEDTCVNHVTNTILLFIYHSHN